MRCLCTCMHHAWHPWEGLGIVVSWMNDIWRLWPGITTFGLVAAELCAWQWSQANWGTTRSRHLDHFFHDGQSWPRDIPGVKAPSSFCSRSVFNRLLLAPRRLPLPLPWLGRAWECKWDRGLFLLLLLPLPLPLEVVAVAPIKWLAATYFFFFFGFGIAATEWEWWSWPRLWIHSRAGKWACLWTGHGTHSQFPNSQFLLGSMACRELRGLNQWMKRGFRNSFLFCFVSF